jgi:hypothetical protein
MMPPFSDQKSNPDVQKDGMDIRKRIGFWALRGQKSEYNFKKCQILHKREHSSRGLLL